MQDSWLGLWIDEGGKTLLLARDGKTGRYLATVTPSIGAAPFRPEDQVIPPESNYSLPEEGTYELPADWIRDGRGYPRTLSYLQVEADPPSGRTYQLFFMVANPPGEAEHFVWRPATAADPVEAVRIVPETGPSFLDAAVWMDDEGEIPWAEPLTPFRRARAEEDATYRGARPAGDARGTA